MSLVFSSARENLRRSVNHSGRTTLVTTALQLKALRGKAPRGESPNFKLALENKWYTETPPLLLSAVVPGLGHRDLAVLPRGLVWPGGPAERRALAWKVRSVFKLSRARWVY